MSDAPIIEVDDKRAKRREYERKWREKNPGYIRDWKKKNRDRYNEKHRVNATNRRRKRRLEAIGALGGCCCQCGFSDERALQFDHKTPILRRTNNTRHKGGSINAKEHKAIVENKEHDIQLLCANCHAI